MKPRLCLAPGCNTSITRGRVVCRHHWLALPAELKAKISGLLMSHNLGSAQIVLEDHYRGA